MVALDESLLDELATALGVTPDFVKSFKDENVIYNIQNNQDTSSSNQQYNYPTIHNDGSDKLVALLEKSVEEDRIKTQSISELSKAVLNLAAEVNKLKEGK